MTQSVNTPAGTLDLSVQSTRIVARKGETLIWLQQFETDDTPAQPVDISTWTFTAGARNGSDADGNPVTVPIDVVSMASSVGGTTDTIQLYVDTAVFTALTPSSGRSSTTTFEIEANIPSGRNTSGGDPITLTQVVQVGQLELFADIYTAPVGG